MYARITVIIVQHDEPVAIPTAMLNLHVATNTRTVCGPGNPAQWVIQGDFNNFSYDQLRVFQDDLPKGASLIIYFPPKA